MDVTQKDIEDLIKSFTPSPTKENPIHWWANGYNFKNDGESLFCQKEDEYQPVTREEYLKMIGR